MSILIIEDDPVTRSLLEGILGKAGYTTLAASCVRAAIAHLESQSHIDLIICDIMLPDRDGLVFVTSLRCDRRFNKISVLMCSSLHDASTVRRSMALGVVEYVVKPVRPEQLLAKVAKALDRHIPPVLLVSEDEAVLDYVERTLLRSGYNSLKATSVAEALTLIGANKVAAVITGASVGGVSGLDFLIEVKSRDPFIPVLVITDHNGMAEQLDVMSEGADGYIVKPFSNLDLVNRLERCIKRSCTPCDR